MAAFVIQPDESVGTEPAHDWSRSEIERGYKMQEAEQMLRNGGIDPSCGTCMEIVHTGSASGHPHTCKR